MRTLVIVGSSQTRQHRRGRAEAPWVYSPRRWEGDSMTARGPRSSASPPAPSATTSPSGACGGADQDHRQAERPRGGDLAVGRGAAGVLGDDNLDALLARGDAARRPRANGPRARISRAPGGQAIGRVDGADDDSRAARRGRPQARAGRRSGTRACGIAPIAAAASAASATSVQRSPSHGAPGRAAQDEKRRRRVPAGRAGIRRDALGEGMGRIDHRLDAGRPAMNRARPSAPPKPPTR